MTQGSKNDKWIFRRVAQSKGNCLSVEELLKKNANNSAYRTLDRLAPKTYDEDIPGIHLFCHNDFFKKGITDEQLGKLKEKLEETYGSFLQWNWKKIKPILAKHNATKVTIIFKEDDNNFIKVKLFSRTKSKNKKDKLAIMTWKYESIDYGDITKKFRFRREREIPLIPESKDGKTLYFRSLSSKSYYIRRGCLKVGLNEKGRKLNSFYKNKIDDIWNSQANL